MSDELDNKTIFTNIMREQIKQLQHKIEYCTTDEEIQNCLAEISSLQEQINLIFPTNKDGIDIQEQI